MGQNSTKAGVVVWGQGDHGQLGLGGPAGSSRAFTPRLLERLTNVKAVVCGGHHTIAITEKDVRFFCQAINNIVSHDHFTTTVHTTAERP